MSNKQLLDEVEKNNVNSRWRVDQLIGHVNVADWGIELRDRDESSKCVVIELKIVLSFDYQVCFTQLLFFLTGISSSIS